METLRGGVMSDQTCRTGGVSKAGAIHSYNLRIPSFDKYSFSHNKRCKVAVSAQPGQGGSSTKKKPFKRDFKQSDGVEHLGSALTTLSTRPFPGPPPDVGPPLRVLPIGGLGEIGMNCMLVGARDRWIVIDAGLLFPDFSDLGMQKILPDTSFLHQWRDKIEALVITHGHEDHIGALPWVVPALDPSTPIYASGFVMQLIQRRLTEYTLFNPSRFRTFQMNERFKAGPFEVEPVRVTHSIPDCCGLIMRSDYGTIVHTGDWKIDETPMDGQNFDRNTFAMLAKEEVALMMSDSTNVLTPGRTVSETVVRDSLVNQVLAHAGKGRVIVTQFASNLHRLYSVKQAAEASGRKICFIGISLNMYLEAAFRDGRAPFDPKEVIAAQDLDQYDPNQVLVVTTGSQAEPRAALSLASRESSPLLKVLPSDLVLYSAKVIPGNEKKVVKMLNSLAVMGATVRASKTDNLHTSGHAYQGELVEILQSVKPQHFLPVHGEYTFLCEHARLAKEQAGVNYCEVIKNGMLLGVNERRNRNEVSTSGMAVLGEAALVQFYNDGNKGTGTSAEMQLLERTTLAFEGIVIVAVDVFRTGGSGGGSGTKYLSGRVRLTTRGMWTDNGRLLEMLHEELESAISYMAFDSSLSSVERVVIDQVRKKCRAFNNKRPEVICVAHEHDPRAATIPEAAQKRRMMMEQQKQQGAAAAANTSSPPPTPTYQAATTPPTPVRRVTKPRADASSSSPASGGPPLKVLPNDVLQKRRKANPRDAPPTGQDAAFD